MYDYNSEFIQFNYSFVFPKQNDKCLKNAQFAATEAYHVL